MNKKLKVIVDMDGVLVDLASHWSAWLNEAYGLDLTTNDFAKKIEDSPKIIQAGLTKKQVKLPFYQEGFWLNLPPNGDALENFPKIISEFDVSIVTAPHWESMYSAHEKKIWIEKYFGNIKFIATEHKAEVRADVIIDDLDKNLIVCKQAGMTTICFSQPWSVSDAPEIDYTVHTFLEAYDKLKELCSNGSKKT